MGATTLPFAEMGWEVHAFEPDSINREHLLAAAASYSNVKVIPAAVSNRPGTMRLYRSPLSSGISSLSAFHESHEVGEDVEVVTLDDYLSDAVINHVDFLKVDAEGHDLFVLQGVAWRRTRPTAIVCEFEDRKTLPLQYDYRDLAQFLLERSYAVIVSEWHPIEQYGAAHRWRRLHRYPCDLQDENAWGNLIALPAEWTDRLLSRGGLMARRLTLRQKVERLRPSGRR